MRDLIQLTYVSESCPGFEEHQIPELLKFIRPANARQHITGMLLYIGSSFLQVIEGEVPAVDSLYARIARDQRHRNVTLLTRQSAGERFFADWTMDFATVDALDAGSLVGEPQLFTTPRGPCSLGADGAKKLIASFRRPSWQRSAKDRQNPRASNA